MDYGTVEPGFSKGLRRTDPPDQHPLPELTEKNLNAYVLRQASDAGHVHVAGRLLGAVALFHADAAGDQPYRE